MARSSKQPTPVNLKDVQRYSIKKRANKTTLKSFGRPMRKIKSADFFESLPKILKAADLDEFISLTATARKKNKPFHWLLGAHTIKVGLSPVIIDLLKRDIVTGLSFNCAGLIHDLELAFFGGTSENVQEGLADGSFGMVRETADLFAQVVELAATEECGLGLAGGRFLNRMKAPNRKLSVFAMADKLDRPITVHVGIGTDIVAQHPCFDAAAVATASHIDFRILAQICRSLDRGGVIANIGSAVLLPEVFLKALTVARNLNQTRSKLTSANFDMIMHYRPTENVVKRPTLGAGKGFSFVGHHEIMVPLLAWGLRSKIG